MPLPPSGEIRISQINVELGLPSDATQSLGSPGPRELAGVPSGQITMSNFYGKSAFTLNDPPPSGEHSHIGVGGTVYCFIAPTNNARLGGTGSQANTAYGSPVDTGAAAGTEFRYDVASGTINYTNMTAGVWYPVGSGYYVGNKRVSNGMTTGVINLYFRKGGVQVGPSSLTITSEREVG